jgi:porin
LARAKILYGLAGISLATAGLGLPALAADMPLKAVPWVEPLYPVALRPWTRVLTDDTPSPYQLKLQYTGEAWHNDGGKKTGDDYMANYLAVAKIDTEKAFGWTGGRIVASAFYNTGQSLNEVYVGAFQQPSRPIDVNAPSLLRLYEAYYNQTWGNTDVRVGIMDLQTMFGATRPMDVFFNGAFAWTHTLDVSGRTGLNGPSTYPNTSFGGRVKQTINEQWSVQAAVVNGLADGKSPGVGLPPQTNDIIFNDNSGALVIGEVDYTPIARTKIMAGYWQYTGVLNSYTRLPNGKAVTMRGSNGAYVGAATRLYTVQGARGLDGFVNFGVADSTVKLVDRSVNAGLTWTGLFDARPADKLGMAFGMIHNTDPLQKILAASRQYAGNSTETTYELTYRATLSDWLTVQPNIQYIVDPTLGKLVNGKVKNAFVFGLHFEVGHLFNL